MPVERGQYSLIQPWCECQPKAEQQNSQGKQPREGTISFAVDLTRSDVPHNEYSPRP
jgi:hypothetical protein